MPDQRLPGTHTLVRDKQKGMRPSKQSGQVSTVISRCLSVQQLLVNLLWLVVPAEGVHCCAWRAASSPK